MLVAILEATAAGVTMFDFSMSRYSTNSIETGRHSTQTPNETQLPLEGSSRRLRFSTARPEERGQAFNVMPL
jgi:hypothetical protein